MGKRLKFQIGSNLNESLVQTQAEREVTLLKLQNHPMVCQIVDAIKDETNSPCLIMYKCKQSLENIIKENPEKPLPESYILRVFTMICIPLSYIHKKNIVHRDLKPDNIL